MNIRQIAEDWYQVEDIKLAIKNSQSEHLGEFQSIPEDIYSDEFAQWLTDQYRLAMMKGIQIANDQQQGH